MRDDVGEQRLDVRYEVDHCSSNIAGFVAGEIGGALRVLSCLGDGVAKRLGLLLNVERFQ